MALSKEQVGNLIYKRKSNKSKVVSNLRQPSDAEKEQCKTIADNLLSYILSKHS